MKGKDKIYEALVARDIRHPNVFKGWHHSTLKSGWHYIEFGRSQAIWLGTSVQEALDTISLRAEH